MSNTTGKRSSVFSKFDTQILSGRFRKPSFGKVLCAPFLLRAILGVVICFSTILMPASSLQAQKKYTPEHPDVQDMIDRALNFLGEAEPSSYSEAVLFALAAYKAELWRPTAEPKDNPIVQNGLAFTNRVLSDQNFRARSDFRSIYAPAMCLIFLLDMGPEEYETEIENMLELLISRQQDSGAWGYSNQDGHGDTSQMQYIGLALWLAAEAGFEVDPEIGKRALEWMIASQDQSGGWIYTIPPLRRSGGNLTEGLEIRHSLVAAGGGTVYILAEWLQLASAQTVQQRNQRDSAEMAADLEIRLPPSVAIYDPDTPEEVSGKAKVRFDTSRLRQSMARTNSWFRSNFRPNPEKWTYYYLYAFERYASLRELVDGTAGTDDWYDRGVEFLKRAQRENGAWPRPAAAGENAEVSTALAVLFLTRSMQLSIAARAEGTLVGGIGFPDGETRRGADGQFIGVDVQKDINELLIHLDQAGDKELDAFVEQIKNLRVDSEGASRTQQLAQLRALVKQQDYRLRKVAVKLLGEERSLDNVPALLYALTDPELEIAREANNGLKFISRKVESIPMSDNPDKSELRSLKEDWTEWYLSIRPDARLIEDPDSDG